MLTLIVSLLTIAPAQAGTSLEVKVVHEYSENRTHLRQTGKKWICDTELQKGIELKGEAESPKLFQPAKQKPGLDCRSRFFALSTSGSGKKKKWEGCSDDPAVSAFLKALNKECGR
jgi:hypothetical protein